jgi:hypothetical protein
MKKYGLMVCFFVIMNSAYSEIYKWVDGNGEVHFSDKPHPGAVKIDLPKTQTYAPLGEQKKEQTIEDKTGDADFAYESVTILQPEDQVTLRNTDGSVSIIAALKPQLRPGDKLQVIFDGSPIGKLKATTEFSLRGINRGSHTLAVQVTNGEGNVLNTSNTVTIFMMPPRTNMGNKRPISQGR